MAYLAPSEFVTKMVDAGESKVFMSTRDTVIRAYMAGAILALAAWFAITINVQTGQPLVGALLFPVGFCMLSLLGFDLLTGVFVLTPLAWLNRRPGVTIGGVLRNWGLVFLGNFAGALTTAFLMAFVTTFGFTQSPDKVGAVIGNIGEARTLGYASHGAAGMLTLFFRGVLCNWMVSTGVVGALISTTVPGKVIAMWMPILVFCLRRTRTTVRSPALTQARLSFWHRKCRAYCRSRSGNTPTKAARRSTRISMAR